MLSNEVEKAIAVAANTHGIPIDYMRAMAWIESKGNPRAYNKGSKASGLYQFLPATAKEYRLTNPFDAAQSADAAARFTKNNLTILKKYGFDIDLNKEPHLGYLAHQQGAGGLYYILKSVKNGTPVSHALQKNMNDNSYKGITPANFLEFWKKRYYKEAAAVGIKERKE